MTTLRHVVADVVGVDADQHVALARSATEYETEHAASLHPPRLNDVQTSAGDATTA